MMYQLTNTGSTPRIVHDAFGKPAKILPGKMATLELADTIANIFEHAQGRGEPVRIRMLQPDEVLAYTPDPSLENKVVVPPQPTASELLPQLSELGYDDLLRHCRLIMGEAYDLGPRPKKLVVMQRLRDLAEKEIVNAENA